MGFLFCLGMLNGAAAGLGRAAEATREPRVVLAAAERSIDLAAKETMAFRGFRIGDCESVEETEEVLGCLGVGILCVWVYICQVGAVWFGLI